MLRCLILFRSAAMSSSRLIVLPSIMLATISAYARMREFTRVGSSRSRPSNANTAFSDGAAFSDGDSEIASGAAGSLNDSTPEKSTLRASEGLSGVGGPTGDGGASTSPGEVFSASFTDLLRLPLRRFLFFLPSAV